MDDTLHQSAKDLIKLRHSVRNYSDTPLSQEVINKIETYIATVENPFHKKVKIKFIKKDLTDKETKLGTYGVIKGANYFLAAACEQDDLSLIALGYTLEKVILYCTALGLGTVWLGGTFNKGGFTKATNLSDTEILPIVSPVGYEGGKKSLIAALIGENTNKRKPYTELFFNQNFDTPLQPNHADPYFEPLEMLRLAPSAVNKQPWRVLKDKTMLHFYLISTKGLTKIDIGIALCHFHLTALEKGLSGAFAILNQIKDDQDKNFTYILSWQNESK